MIEAPSEPVDVVDNVEDGGDQLLFPLGVQKDMIFENQEALLDEIAKEKPKFGIPQTLRLYRPRYLPSKKYAGSSTCIAATVEPGLTAGSLKVES